MTITTLSSREFNQDTGRAKKATNQGPVFITDRGKPAHVLLSFEEYRRITGGKSRSLLEALAFAGLENIDLEAELPDFRDRPEPPDLS